MTEKRLDNVNLTKSVTSIDEIGNIIQGLNPYKALMVRSD